MHSCAEREKHAEMAVPQASGPHLLVDEDRERRCAGVAEPVDIRRQLVRRDAECFANVVVDSGIGLVREEEIDLLEWSLCSS
jgi:hypothetical protein